MEIFFIALTASKNQPIPNTICQHVPGCPTGVATLIHYYIRLCHCPFMPLLLTFAWWFDFHFKHICLRLCFAIFFLNYSYCFYLSFEFSFYHFLYLSHLFIFLFFNPPFPPFPTSSSSNPHPLPPRPFLSFPPHQNPQPPLKRLSAAAPAPPPCW